MAKYRMEDGCVVDTEKASNSWSESQYHDGRLFISRATGDQWSHEKLYRSRKGRYYVEHWSDWQGSKSRCEFVSEHEAVRWLLENGLVVPIELSNLVDDLVE